jgi:hypothetical protein
MPEAETRACASVHESPVRDKRMRPKGNFPRKINPLE